MVGRWQALIAPHAEGDALPPAASDARESASQVLAAYKKD